MLCLNLLSKSFKTNHPSISYILTIKLHHFLKYMNSASVGLNIVKPCVSPASINLYFP